jgi:hypothetical protein
MQNTGRFSLFVATLISCLLASCGKDEAKPASPSTGRDNTPNGLGVVCTKDSDCEPGLTCRLDTSDPTDYQLCTATCAADADCKSKFADYTMCTGIHACVVTCETDDDCEPGTICDSRNWCQRGGPDSGVTACVGTVAACSTVATQSNCEAAHCQWAGKCKGIPQACDKAVAEGDCTAVNGCQWYQAVSKCSGTPSECINFQTSELCALQSGCIWESSCVGESAVSTCENAGLTFCGVTPGCHLETQ